MASRLDHLLIGAKSLASCIDWASQSLDVQATRGGHHPGRATENALLGLGDQRYLEFIAPSVAAGGNSRASGILSGLHHPTFCWWAISSPDLERARNALVGLDIPCSEIVAGERKTAGGEHLHWRLFYPRCEELGALLPFVIEWPSPGQHPATSLSAGAQLERLALGTLSTAKLGAALDALQLREEVLEITEATQNSMSVTLYAAQRRTTLSGPALPAVA